MAPHEITTSPNCNICSKSDSTPRNFLLDCLICKRSWHHRCHKPPIPDLEVLKYIKATTDLLRQQSQNPNRTQARPQRPTFTCGPCKQNPVTLSEGSNVQVIVIDDSDDEVPSVPKPPPINQIASKKPSLRGSIPIQPSNPPAQGGQPIINPRSSKSSFLDPNEVTTTTSLQRNDVIRRKITASSHKRPEQQSIEPLPFRRDISLMGSSDSSRHGTSSRSPSLNPHPLVPHKQKTPAIGARFVSLPRFEALSMSIEPDDDEDDEEEEDQLAEDDDQPLRPTKRHVIDVTRNTELAPARKSSTRPNIPVGPQNPSGSSTSTPIHVPVFKALPDLLDEEYAQTNDAWSRAAARCRQTSSVPRRSFSINVENRPPNHPGSFVRVPRAYPSIVYSSQDLMRLPVDIFFTLFEFLANEDEGPDVKTLSACCLVSSAISKICEAYLYTCVHLMCGDLESDRLDRTPWYNPQCAISTPHFKSIMESKPHISRFIKTLGIYWVHPNPQAQQKLFDLLQQLETNNVRALHIFSSYVDRWDKMGVPINAFLETILQSPNLKELEVGNIDYFPLYKTFQTPLRSLGMNLITGTPIPGLQTMSSIVPSATCTMPLESLFLDTLATDVMDVSCTRFCRPDREPIFDFSSLSQLAVALNFAHMERDMELTRSIMKQRRGITADTATPKVQMTTFSEMLSDVVQTAKDTLETLALVSYPPITCPLDNAPEFLAFNGCIFASLKCIKMQFFLFRDVDGGLVDNGGWLSLATVVQDRKRFPSLERIEVWMRLSTWPHEDRRPVDPYLGLGRELIESPLRESGIVFETGHIERHGRFV
ncbi:hypothetical protein BJ165DRAFT_1526666 [Panaeolus papilionaceus]|nr:hypothetical protein BJ165DRAFT_1526666 [Panaeolus papilionaceus]